MDIEKKRQLLKSIVSGKISKEDAKKQIKEKEEIEVIWNRKEIREGEKLKVTYNKTHSGKQVVLNMSAKEYKNWKANVIQWNS